MFSGLYFLAVQRKSKTLEERIAFIVSFEEYPKQETPASAGFHPDFRLKFCMYFSSPSSVLYIGLYFLAHLHPNFPYDLFS
jgi:hypothetical protein